MAEYSTREADHRAVDAPKKIRFGNPPHSNALEVLSPYGLGDLGSQESERYFLHEVQASSVIVRGLLLSTGYEPHTSSEYT